MEKCKRGIALCLAVLFLILLLPIPRASAATVEEQVQEKIRWIIASIPDDCDTDYEKALWLHDYLCETVTYKKGFLIMLILHYLMVLPTAAAMLMPIVGCFWLSVFDVALLAVTLLMNRTHGISSGLTASAILRMSVGMMIPS